MKGRSVVITGLGTVNPTGNSVEESWKNICEGHIGIGPITSYDTSDMKVKYAGEVKDFHPEKRIDKREIRHIDRFSQFALYSAAEALEMAGLASLSGDDAKRAGVIVSSGIGGLNIIAGEQMKGTEKGFDRVSPFFIPMAIANMAAARIAIAHGLKGMCSCPVTACAGGTNAVGDAFHRIRDGYEDIMVCGGTEACIGKLGIGGFTSMKALSEADSPEKACIPFDRDRSGFVMGEGCGILVLEERSHAEKRGAEILGEVVGYGANCDAYHITAPDPEGRGAVDCMKQAIADAGIEPKDIDYINAHGTSTKLNDVGETKAIHEVFGEEAFNIPVSSTKSMTGHLLGGAGGVEAVFSVLALKDGFIPPTVGLHNPDPECDLDYVPNTGRKTVLHYALSNSLGFGGHNACLVFKKA
ncbi:MAG: beta-ketoacyl-ACP synthase II [Lachnospiraceae bacterium]|nr:beta-ketoacyl-ACP synthase II [Lachnospiraceae bacterium]